MNLTNEIKIRRLANGWLVETPGPVKDASNDLSGMMTVAAQFLPIISDMLRRDPDDGDLPGTSKPWSGSVPFEPKQPDINPPDPLYYVIGEDTRSYVFPDFIGVLAFLQKEFCNGD